MIARMVLVVSVLGAACGADRSTPRSSEGSAPAESARVIAADATVQEAPSSATLELDTALLVLPDRHRALIGSANPPALPGYTDIGGRLLDSPEGVQWGLSELAFGRERLVTLDSLTHYVERRAHWIAVAAVMLPVPTDSGEVVVSVDCDLNGKPDAHIFALGRWVDSGPHLKDLKGIRAAVRPLVSKRGFEVLPASQVSCWVDEDRG